MSDVTPESLVEPPSFASASAPQLGQMGRYDLPFLDQSGPHLSVCPPREDRGRYNVAESGEGTSHLPYLPDTENLTPNEEADEELDLPDLPDLPRPQLRLAPDDIEYLAARAVSAECARRNGLRFVDAGQHGQHPAGLAIPHRAWRAPHQALGCRIRRREGARFWVNRVVPYFPPSVLEATWLDTAVPLAVVEGPVKALALVALGYTAIGLGGVATGHDPEQLRHQRTVDLHPAFDNMPQKGRSVVLVMDANRAYNHDVMEGEARLALAFKSQGANVCVAALPLRTEPNAKGTLDWGPDDFIAARGAAAFQEVVEAALPADPVQRLAALTGTKDALTELAAEVLSDLALLAYLEVARHTLGGQAVESQVLRQLKRCGLQSPKRALSDALQTYRETKADWRHRRQAEKAESGSPAVRTEEAKPSIKLTLDAEVDTDAAISALAKRRRDLYVRGDVMVEVPPSITMDGRHAERTKVLAVELPRMLEMLSSAANWLQQGQGGYKRVLPPERIAKAVLARKNWVQFREITSVVRHPYLHPDGGIYVTPYDKVTCTYCDADSRFLTVIDDNCTHADAVKAAERLLDLVVDFPFENQAHKSAWLAALLTAFARPAIAGPVPLFIFDANAPGAGKGLLYEIIARLVLGAGITVIPGGSGPSEAEERKLITSLLLEAPELALFDNITGPFGSGALDALLTTSRWFDRLLGGNRTASLLVLTIFFVTANNLQFRNPDTARRACYVRLESAEERPEQRQGFRHPDLIGHVVRERFRIANDVLTILRAYCLAGRPKQDLKPWGSFGAWSDLIRGAIVWLGLADPGDTREALRENTTEEGHDLSTLLTGWEEICETEGEPIAKDSPIRGMSIQRAIDVLREDDLRHQRRGQAQDEDGASRKYTAFRDALSALCSVRPGTLPSARTVSCKLRNVRGRVIGSRRLERTSGGERVWYVERLDGSTPPATASPPSNDGPSVEYLLENV